MQVMLQQFEEEKRQCYQIQIYRATDTAIQLRGICVGVNKIADV